MFLQTPGSQRNHTSKVSPHARYFPKTRREASRRSCTAFLHLSLSASGLHLRDSLSSYSSPPRSFKRRKKLNLLHIKTSKWLPKEGGPGNTQRLVKSAE